MATNVLSHVLTLQDWSDPLVQEKKNRDFQTFPHTLTSEIQQAHKLFQA